MDADRFDAITRLAATSPRRRILAGLLGGVATSVGLLLRTRGAAAEPYYEDRGQTCGGPLDVKCNAPCRTCDEERCVYACPNATHVCAANGQGNCDARISVDKGCCVCRDLANCPSPV
jgi:hypothetical protein